MAKPPGSSRGSYWAASIVPFAAETLRPFTGRVAPVAASEVLCLFGGLILRFCLVLAGSHWLG